jgi:hypothetical protein
MKNMIRTIVSTDDSIATVIERLVWWGTERFGAGVNP